MRNGKKIQTTLLLLMTVVILSTSIGTAAGAASRDVTAKYRTKVTMMLNELDGYLCYDIAFSYDAERSGEFVFDDYAKTSMVCYRRLYAQIYRKSVSYVKKKCKGDLKLFFGNTAKFKLKKYVSRTYYRGMQYMVQNKNGKLEYLGGEYGDSFACGKVSKIIQNGSKYTVTYKEYLRYLDSEAANYRGTYQITLKKAKNQYGFIITDIKRTKVNRN